MRSPHPSMPHTHPNTSQTHPYTLRTWFRAEKSCLPQANLAVQGRPQTHPNAPQPHPNTPQTHPNTPQTHPGKFHEPDCTRRHDSCFFGSGAPPDTPKRAPAIFKHAPDIPKHATDAPWQVSRARLHEEARFVLFWSWGAPRHPNAPQTHPNTPQTQPNSDSVREVLTL